MNHSLKVGFSFGVTSGIITTLGLMVGLNSGTHSKVVILGGILTIAVADAFSDALGIHIAEESENKHGPLEIWQSTLATFFSKFIFASIFIVPVLLLELRHAIVVCIVLGLSILSILSFFMAQEQKNNPLKVIFEHLFIAAVVIFLTNSVGRFIASKFSQ